MMKCARCTLATALVFVSGAASADWVRTPDGEVIASQSIGAPYSVTVNVPRPRQPVRPRDASSRPTPVERPGCDVQAYEGLRVQRCY